MQSFDFLLQSNVNEESNYLGEMSKASTKMVIKVDASTSKKNLAKFSGRKSLKVLQKAATDKENLVGRDILPAKTIYKSKADSETEITELAKRKVLRTQSTQTEAVINTAYNQDQETVVKDITSEETPSEGYWQIIAEKRRLALKVTLDENRFLHNRIEGLEADLEISNKMCDEARALVDLLTEMLEGTEDEDEGRAAIAGLNGLLHGPSTTLNSTGVSAAFEASNFEESSDED